ncbi:hypothetical protein TWF569_003569 [Orbilia oligospora]|nr:hypothetical protein TWF569_003569 [Orbilia oligospora]
MPRRTFSPGIFLEIQAAFGRADLDIMTFDLVTNGTCRLPSSQLLPWLHTSWSFGSSSTDTSYPVWCKVLSNAFLRALSCYRSPASRLYENSEKPISTFFV